MVSLGGASVTSFLPVLRLNFRSFSGLVVSYEPLFLLVKVEWFIFLFVVYGYQGAEEDADQLQLTNKLLQAVLAEAQVVCIGQHLLIAGDLNADPAVIPCLAKGVSAGRYVDLALAFSLGAGLAPDVTCTFNREEGTGSRRDFLLAHAASHACHVTADVACPVVCQPVWPACWLDTPDRSSLSPTRVVQDVWDIYRD